MYSRRTRCSIRGCVTDRKPRDRTRVEFHRFPENMQLSMVWAESTGRGDWTPKPRSVICSRHFDDNDYRILPNGRKQLRSDALPSLAVWGGGAESARYTYQYAMKLEKAERISPERYSSIGEEGVDRLLAMDADESQRSVEVAYIRDLLKSNMDRHQALNAQLDQVVKFLIDLLLAMPANDRYNMALRKFEVLLRNVSNSRTANAAE